MYWELDVRRTLRTMFEASGKPALKTHARFGLKLQQYFRNHNYVNTGIIHPTRLFQKKGGTHCAFDKMSSY